jgi:mannose-6-phosphate isomerase
VERIAGVVQHYAWGDHTFLPQLLGRQPDGQPWAELWLGTHPGGPATIDPDHTGTPRPLTERSGSLPYLLKVLVAAEPLSLQTHPSADQAAAGYAREEQLGIAGDAPERTYRDPFAKPELICAITSFDALCGFRPLGATLALLDRLGAADLAAAVRADGLAGLTGGLILVPQGVAFATIAGMPPEYGLYAAMLPAVVAALWGSSWHLALQVSGLMVFKGFVFGFQWVLKVFDGVKGLGFRV